MHIYCAACGSFGPAQVLRVLKSFFSYAGGLEGSYQPNLLLHKLGVWY